MSTFEKLINLLLFLETTLKQGVNLLAKYQDVSFIFCGVTQNIFSEDCKGNPLGVKIKEISLMNKICSKVKCPGMERGKPPGPAE